MARKAAIVVGSIVGVVVLGSIAIAIARARKSEGGTDLMAPETALQFLQAALGIPTSVAATTAPSGRSYQVAIWALADKEAVLVTSLSPKTVYAIQRDMADRVPSELVDVLPDDTARTDMAALIKSF